MADKKMDPLSAILCELERHCETSKAVTKTMDVEQNLRKKNMLGEGWLSVNTSIATLYHVLEITDIPDEKRGEVIATVSELKATKGSHCALASLLADLKKPRRYGVLTPRQRNSISGKLLRLRGDVYIDDTRAPGDEYCFECGHIAPKEEFMREDKCPNPDCPNPGNWND